MLELISIIASLILCILTPMEVARIRSGKVRKKFADNPQAFITAYQRQLHMLTWLGGVFGASMLLMALLEDQQAEAVVKAIAALIWFTLGVICFVSRRRLPPAEPPGAVSHA